MLPQCLNPDHPRLEGAPVEEFDIPVGVLRFTLIYPAHFVSRDLYIRQPSCHWPIESPTQSNRLARSP
eukprot:12141656-Alexandrium_andersonii.AAC.1